MVGMKRPPQRMSEKKDGGSFAGEGSESSGCDLWSRKVVVSLSLLRRAFFQAVPVLLMADRLTRNCH